MKTIHELHIDDFDNIIKEIKAGMVLFGASKKDKAWNDCALRSIRIVENYKEGKGLFQLCTTKKK